MITGYPSLSDDPGRRARSERSVPGRDPQLAGRERKAVLVVDDDRSILETMTDLLQGEGYHVVTAADGLDALDLLRGANVSVVLLDMRMPRMDGWEFARTARERGSHVPIVVMTAANDARRWAQEIGADAYIAKPFDIDKLLALVKRFTGRGQTLS